jgi:non-ribosomal peptide synthetase component F
MAIEMAGAVYCPLSPGDPQQRLHALIEKTYSRLVLIHWLTGNKFTNDIVALDIDLVLNNNNVETEVSFDPLSNVLVTLDSIAYIIFTSGSTGTPKAVG